ncbi:MAG: glycosyltransferase [Alphaproteobacteria bacterium]|nr:glycosyltransferase [Alphaproteobacteria bacterium]
MAAFATARNAAPSPLCQHVLHVFPSFGVGGVPLRMVRTINHFGKRFRHTVIALDNNFEAAGGLAGDLDVVLSPVRAQKWGTVHAMLDSALVLRRLRPDLLITYNWGAIEWAMANRLRPGSRHIHFEAGFSRREADSQIPRRVLFRRWALARCALVVVPSRLLEDLACRVWRLPMERVRYVPNGVDVARFSAPARDVTLGFARRPDELVIGTVAPLRPEKNVGRLLRVFATLDTSFTARLVVAGDGIERRELERLAGELRIADRVVFTGQIVPEAVLGTFDIFALSSDTEQMPNALLEAMAASRAIAAVNVGDVKSIVSEDNRDFIVPRDDIPAFAAAIAKLLRDPEKRRALGLKNRERVVAAFSQERMFAAYSEIFALGRPH